MPRTTAIILLALSLLAFSPLASAEQGVGGEHRAEESETASDENHRAAESCEDHDHTSENGDDTSTSGGNGSDENETTDPENGTGDEDNATVPPQHVGFQAEDSGPIAHLNATGDLVPGENSTDLDVHLVLTLQGETGVPEVDEALGNATAGTPAEDVLALGATVEADAEMSLPGSGGL